MNGNNGRCVLFVSLTGDEQIRLYDLDPTDGALQLRATSDAHGPTGALYLHPCGDVMLAAHVMSTTLASFRLDVDTGDLSLINKVDTGIAYLDQAYRNVEQFLELGGVHPKAVYSTAYRLAIAHMRLGETQNCCLRHAADSCLLPVRGGGVPREFTRIPSPAAASETSGPRH